MNKKAIAILGAIFILIVGTLGFLIYAKYGKKDNGSTPPPANNVVDNQGDNPVDTGTDNYVTPTTTPSGYNNLFSKFVKLTEQEQIVSPVLFFNGSGITFFDKDGKLYQADLQDEAGTLQLSNKRQLEIPAKFNIAKILWPSRSGNFIAEFHSFGKTSWSFYNNDTGFYTDLPEQVESLDWMPSGDKIIYVWLDSGKASLGIADPDTKNWKEISEMWELDNSIHISPDGLNILYYRTNNSESTNAINLTTPDGKLWRGLVKEGYNYGVLWSPDSSKFIFGKKERNSQKYQLWYYDLLGGEVKNLGLFTTVEKAVWDKDSRTVYASVPTQGAAEDGGLTTDTFYKIDVTTLEKKEFKPENLTIDGRGLFLNLSGDKLFFGNAQDGGLYYLDLNQ
jgi:hypothetical protein